MHECGRCGRDCAASAGFDVGVGVAVVVVVVVGGSQLLKSLWLVVRAADGGANFVNFGGYFVAVALPFVSVH